MAGREAKQTLICFLLRIVLAGLVLHREPNSLPEDYNQPEKLPAHIENHKSGSCEQNVDVLNGSALPLQEQHSNVLPHACASPERSWV